MLNQYIGETDNYDVIYMKHLFFKIGLFKNHENVIQFTVFVSRKRCCPWGKPKIRTFIIKIYHKSLLQMVKYLKLCKITTKLLNYTQSDFKEVEVTRIYSKIAVSECFPDRFSLSTNGDLISRMFQKRDRLVVFQVVPK